MQFFNQNRRQLTPFSVFVAVFFLVATFASQSRSDETFSIDGLQASVEILIDSWGVPHIYAENQRDLFFAQGFNAARDRLFQLEMWRRQATGTLSEVFGEQAIENDRGSRLLRFRGDLQAELSHYHPDGAEIIQAFVDGINAYVDRVTADPGDLPLEFHLLEIEPQHWTPDIVVSRHNGLFRNAGRELTYAKLLKEMDSEALKALLNLHPGDPDLRPDPGLDLEAIDSSVLDLYRASRSIPDFSSDHITSAADRRAGIPAYKTPFVFPGFDYVGSNNWAVAGEKTLTGRPLLANDPHRVQQVPSLRYFVHLSAPEWNVIGGGEPALPGVSIGHNGIGAWGLTIFSIDQEDIYVYEIDPSNPLRYRYKDGWEEMDSVSERISVKGQGAVTVQLDYTRHGPVIHRDEENNLAYGLRAAWLEKGTAPYLASLRINQAQNWQQFREACRYFLAPSENMVWADIHGDIGWQATGIAPRRRGWDGLLPVPGDGRYEWDGYLDPWNLPSVVNPETGFIATANEENLPPDYPHGVGFEWADPYRFARIHEVLDTGRKVSLADMQALQLDVLSIPARTLLPILLRVHSDDPEIQKAREILSEWNFKMEADSTAAAIYAMWERRLKENVWSLYLDESTAETLSSRSLQRLIERVTTPDHHFGDQPIEQRNQMILSSLAEALEELDERFGSDWSSWRYGHEKFHHIYLEHVLSDAVSDELVGRLNVGPVERGGSGETVNMTNSNDRQTSGASFRIIIDIGNWDRSLATNSPGQSGDPDSSFYSNLFSMWARGDHFPLLYSRTGIEENHVAGIKLEPSP